MKRFAVAYISFFDNEIKLCTVDANSPEEAILPAMKAIGETTDDIAELVADKTLEQIKDLFFDWDSAIEVKEI
jgi:hypothetical protein